MRKRFQRFYDHDSKEVNVSKGFIANLQNSCISIGTMNILVDYSSVFRACAYRSVELNGYAHFELPERQREISGFEGMIQSFMNN